MKKLYFIIISILIINISAAQELVHSFPETSSVQTNVGLIIHGNNTHFNACDSNLIILTNNIDTLEKWVPNTSYNDNLINVSFSNNILNTGFYTLIVFNNIDDSLLLKDALYITKNYLDFTTDNVYNYENSISANIGIKSESSHFLSANNVSAFLINKESDTIYLDNISTPTEDSLLLSFTPDSSKYGSYNLFTYNDLDSIGFFPNIVNIKNSTYTQVDSINPDTLVFYDMETTFTIYGNKTNFIQDSIVAYIKSDVYYSEVHDIIVLNDSVLKFKAYLPIVCKEINKPHTFNMYVHNNIDGKLDFVSKIYISGGINNSIQNNNIKLFPNPISNGEFTLEFDEITTQNSTITIFNEIGHEINSVQLNKGISIKTIDVSGLAKGIYFYNIITKDGQINAGKFIIQ